MTIVIDGTTGISGVDGTASNPSYEGTDSNTGIFFPAADTIAFAEGGAEVARFDSSGNFGIGTSSPNSKLNTYAAANALSIQYVATNQNAVSPTAAIGFNVSDSSETTAACAKGGIGFTRNAAFGGGYLAFYNNNSGAAGNFTTADEKARIDASGRLIVGTTTTVGPSKLFSYFAGNVDYGLGIQDSTTTSGAGFIGFFNSAGTAVGNIVRNGTTNAVLYNTSSDYRLKEQVRPISNGLQRVLALRPSAWVWKDCDGQVGEGFIAHEVQEVVSGCVSGEKDAIDAKGNPVYQGMDSSYLVATLTAAIQEQQQMIETLQAKVAALEAR